MSEGAGWTTIESDPGVFTDLLARMGVEGIEMQELYSLDEGLEEFNYVYGLIFLFKYEGRVNREALGGQFAQYTQDGREIFFARQVINNACATQALLNLLFNLDKEVQLGPTLTDFKSFTQDFDPETRGEAIGSSEPIRLAHNTYARNDPFHIEHDADQRNKEDAFHFIAYLPVQGELVELDGLQQSPISHGRFSQEEGENANWITLARHIIRKRIDSYQGGELRFNLMGVLQDRRLAIRRQLKALEGENSSGEQMRLMQLLSEEEDKRLQWSKDNDWRRHSFLPLVVELLKALAKNGELAEGVQHSKRKRSMDSGL